MLPVIILCVNVRTVQFLSVPSFCRHSASCLLNSRDFGSGSVRLLWRAVSSFDVSVVTNISYICDYSVPYLVIVSMKLT